MASRQSTFALFAALLLLASAATTHAVPSIVNGSFEDNGAAFVEFPGYVQAFNASNPAVIAGWTHANRVGVNSGVSPIDPFTNNGDTPALGTFAAFLQVFSPESPTTTLQQSVSGFEVGKKYYLTYRDNARGGNTVSLTVSASGVGVIDAAHSVSAVGGSNPYLYDVTNVFTATSNTHTVSFVGSAVGDNTLLLDNVRIHEFDGLPDSGGNLGFETVDNGPTAFTLGSFRYNPAGASWNFPEPNGTGIASNGSGFTNANPNAPEGTNVAFIQGAASFTDVFYDFDPTRGYQIIFSEANRNGSPNDFEVLLDGQVIFAQHFPAGTSYATVTSPMFFPIDAGNDGQFILQFRGINSLGGDRTAFVDNISFRTIPEPASAALGLMGLASLAMRRRFQQA